MHRQIAGKLTGRVTKWIVLVAWIVALVGLGSLRRQADRRPEQRGLLVAARRAPSRPRRSTSSSRSSDPNDIPTLVVYEPRRPASPRPTSRRWTSRPPRSPSSTASPTRARCRPTCAEQAGVPVPFVSEDGEVAYVVFTFNFGKNGWNDMPDAADEHPRHRRRSTASTVHLAGVRRPGRRLRRGVRGHRHQPARDHARRGHHDPAVHLPQPGAVDPADLLRRRRLLDVAGAWSTSWPSTPTSPSTARARRSWASW